MTDPVRIQLPPSTPNDYLRCMALFRDLEQAMIERPSLAESVAAEGAAFVRDEVSDYVSGTLAPAIVEQAVAGRERGEDEVAPVIEVRAEVLSAAAANLRARAEWIGSEGVLRALGLDPMDGSLGDLRLRIVEAIEAEVEEEP